MPAAPVPARVDTRSLVLDAALDLFSGQGYFNISVHDIVRASGVSIGSIYHHFGDKEGIARALQAHLGTRMAQMVADVAAQADTCRDQSRALIARLFDMTEAEPRTMAFLFYARHREFLPDEPPVCSSRPFVMLRELVERGMARGEVRRMDVLVASSSLFGGAFRMITSRLDGIVPEPLPAYLDAVWSCGWRAVAVEAEPSTSRRKRSPR